MRSQIDFISGSGCPAEHPEQRVRLCSAGAVHEMSIINTSGQTVYRVPQTAGSATVQVNVSGFPAGVYFVKANGEVKKFVKE